MLGKKMTRLLIAVLILGISCAPSPRKANTYPNRKVVEEDPFVSYQKGVMMLKKGEYTVAINFFQKAINGDPNNANYWNLMGLALGPIGETQEAINAFKKSLEIAPEMTDVHNNLGTIYIENGEYDKAMEEFSIVLKDKTYPTPYFVYFNIGLLKRKLKLYDEAIFAFEQAIQLKKDFIRAYFELTGLYFDSKRYEDCLNAIHKCKKKYPNEPKLLIMEAESNYYLNNLSEAKRALTKLSILFPPEDIAKRAKELKKKITRKEWSD